MRMKETEMYRNALMLLKHQNFRRAAKALNISQPTLSRRIQLLEQSVGEKLFERASGSILPTQAGMIFLKHARIMLSSLEAMQAEIGRHQNIVEGSLYIGAGIYPACALLGPAVGRFSVLYPNISIQVEIGNWNSMPRQLLQKDFDYVVMETSEIAETEDFELINLNTHQAFFYCRQGHPLLKQPGLNISDLAAYPKVTVKLPYRLNMLFDALFPGATKNQAPSRPQNIICNDLSTMNAMISNCDAIGIATFASLVDELNSGEFVALPVYIPALKSSYNIVKRKRLSLSPAARAFMDIIIEIDKAHTESEPELIQCLGPARKIPHIRGHIRHIPYSGSE